MNNPVQWLEIPTGNIERAKSFYGTIFGLQFQPVQVLGDTLYLFGHPDQPGSSGALIQSGTMKPGTDGPVIYFSCEEVSHKLAAVEAEGGTVLVQKTDIGEFGFFGHFLDTEGNKIGLHSSA